MITQCLGKVLFHVLKKSVNSIYQLPSYVEISIHSSFPDLSV